MGQGRVKGLRVLGGGGELDKAHSPYIHIHFDYAINVSFQVLFGLEYLQRLGWVHLNLQPASILVSHRERCDIKLTDFSCARKIVSPDGESVPRIGYADFMGMIEQTSLINDKKN